MARTTPIVDHVEHSKELLEMQSITSPKQSSSSLNEYVHDGSGANETNIDVSLPDWINVKVPVLIQPDNHSGVIRFVGQTHFSVNIYSL